VPFKAKLFRYPGPGGWTFAPVPDAHAPPVTHGWGRTPVRARVDGKTWETSVWRDKTYGTLLPVPRSVRGRKGDGDEVQVELLPAGSRPVARRQPKKTAPSPPRAPRR
jgi:Domain of unknown function (DUF1905)